MGKTDEETRMVVVGCESLGGTLDLAGHSPAETTQLPPIAKVPNVGTAPTALSQEIM